MPKEICGPAAAGAGREDIMPAGTCRVRFLRKESPRKKNRRPKRHNGTALPEGKGGHVCTRPGRLLETLLVGNGELAAALGAAARKHLAAGGGSHSFTEAVLVYPLAARRLESPFHGRIFFSFLLSIHAECKGITNSAPAKIS